MKRVSHRTTIKLVCSLLLFVPLIVIGEDQVSDAALLHAKELLRSTPLIDGHNDLPWVIREETGGDVLKFRLEDHNEFDTDIPRLRRDTTGYTNRLLSNSRLCC